MRQRTESPKSSQELREEIETNNRLYLILSLTVRILTLIGVIVSVFLILQNQLQIKNQIEETKKQSEINQQYIRCIVLLPATAYQNPDSRTKAVDNCAVKSHDKSI